MTASEGLSAGSAPGRAFLELITEEQEPEPGEERVYGEVATPIAAGRRTRRIRERAASTLERLEADERVLELGLLSVGEHDLTLGRDPVAVGTAGARPGAPAGAARAATGAAAPLGLAAAGPGVVGSA